MEQIAIGTKASSIQEKPQHLAAEYAAQFRDASIVAAYGYRPPYPAATFDILAGLISGEPPESVILDLGCGTGDLTRPFAHRVVRIDAVDISAPMIALARTLPDGDERRIRWIVTPAERAKLEPPYALVTAAESLHWMDWPIIMPRIAAVLERGAVLAVVNRIELDNPWWPDLLPIIQRYTTNRDYQPYNLIAELESRGLFTLLGQWTTRSVPVRQTITDHIESLHSRNGLSRDRMTLEAAAVFDAACRALLATFAESGTLGFSVAAEVAWGAPRG